MLGNASLVARKHNLSPSTVSYWLRNMKKSIIYNKNNNFVLLENECLKKIIGEKGLEIDMLMDLIKKQTANRIMYNKSRDKQR